MENISTRCLLLIFFFSLVLNSQSKIDKITKFTNSTDATVTYSSTSDRIEFIKFQNSKPYIAKGDTNTDKSLNFISESDLFGNLNRNDFSLEKSQTDTHGQTHITLRQNHNGIPVFDGLLRFHFDAQNNITGINGNYFENIKVSSTPNISEQHASTIALVTISNQNLNRSGMELFIHKNELVIYPKGIVMGHITTNHLAYHIEVRNNTDVREYVFVDAHNGEIIDQFTGIAHAINRIVYEGNTNPSNIVWQEGDAFPGSLTIWQQNEVVASEHVYNFFKNAFNYISFDNADGQMITINNNPGLNCPNASWNGFSANYCNGTATDDVIAHEWGHAYTEYTNNLIYAWQSGAINEAYSDIWGETVDLLNSYQDTGEDLSLRTSCNSSDRWRMGEDATAFGGAIRDMWDPTCNNDPGKVSDTEYWCTTGDQGGVHINSGIPNKAYALLVDGGTFNGYTITPIGFTKAAHIFWRAQSQYLTATSDFFALADALEASVNDLLGVNLEGLSTTNTPAGLSGEIINTTDVNQVNNAILAVEMRMSPDACNFQPLLGQTPDPCQAATTNPIFIEDWETGMDGWTISQLPTNPGTWESRDWTLENNLPKGRTGTGIFGIDPINGDCNTDLENGVIRLESPVINIPDYSVGTNEMIINHYISTETNWDGANIKYSLNGGAWEILPATAFLHNPYNGTINPASIGNDNPMASEEAFTGSDQGSVSGSWGRSIIDLSQINVTDNTSVQFRFEMGTDGCNGREGWYIDEIVIYNCNFVLAVQDFESISEAMIIFPNPSSGIFTIRKTSEIALLSADVYDINGRLIKTVDLSDLQFQKKFDLSEANSGIYFVQITANNSKETFKIIKK